MRKMIWINGFLLRSGMFVIAINIAGCTSPTDSDTETSSYPYSATVLIIDEETGESVSRARVSIRRFSKWTFSDYFDKYFSSPHPKAPDTVTDEMIVYCTNENGEVLIR
jgi:hypothetical protein